MTNQQGPDCVDLVRAALAEDLGLAGDITSTLTVSPEATGTALVVARGSGTISGTECVIATYAVLDPAVTVTLRASDGDRVSPGDVVAEVEGPARSILTGERVALNFLGHLSGVATATRALVDRVADTDTRICDTRKTTPGLRSAEKRAVVHGGGTNHRFGLHDAVLVKDNHIGLGGGLDKVLARLAEGTGHLVRVEVEVDTLDQLREVLAHEAAGHAQGLHPRVHAVLLDNMTPAELREAVGLVRAHPTSIVTEASGGVTIDSVAALAASGVDVISSGALTHSAPALDVALDLS